MAARKKTEKVEEAPSAPALKGPAAAAAERTAEIERRQAEERARVDAYEKSFGPAAKIARRHMRALPSTVEGSYAARKLEELVEELRQAGL